MFDSIPIARRFVPEVEPVAIECGLQPRRSVNEKVRVVDVVYLAKLSKEDFRDSGCSGRNSRIWRM